MHISLRKFRPFTRKNRSDKRSNIVGLVLFIHFLLPPDLMKLLNRLNRSFLTYCRASCTCVVVLTLIKLTRTYIIYLYTHSKRVRVLIYSLIIIQYFHKYTRSRWTRAAWCLVVIIYIYIYLCTTCITDMPRFATGKEIASANDRSSIIRTYRPFLYTYIYRVIF